MRNMVLYSGKRTWAICLAVEVRVGSMEYGVTQWEGTVW